MSKREQAIRYCAVLASTRAAWSLGLSEICESLGVTRGAENLAWRAKDHVSEKMGYSCGYGNTVAAGMLHFAEAESLLREGWNG